MRIARVSLVCILAPSMALVLGCSDQPVAPSAVPQRPLAAVGPTSDVAAPSNVTAVASAPNQITVRWQDNSGNETGFEVHRSANSPFYRLSTTKANTTTLSDGGVSEGPEFCYMVRAVRAKGANVTASPFSNVACSVTASALPVAAYETTAKPLDSSMMVFWRGLGLDFRIDRSRDNGGTWQTAGTAYNTRQFFDPAVSEQRVCYRVVTYNAIGPAAPSNVACATSPAAPSAPTATAVDAQTLELTWLDNSSVEDGYEVWEYVGYWECCETDGCNSGIWEGFERVATLPPNATSYQVPGVLGLDVCGFTRWFSIRALKDGGSVSGGDYVVDP